MMFNPATTVPSRNRAAWWGSVPSPTSSYRDLAVSTNLRMLTDQWSPRSAGARHGSAVPPGGASSSLTASKRAAPAFGRRHPG